MLNNPISLIGTTQENFAAYSFVSCSDERINVGAIKKSERGDGYIVRLNETNNERHNITLSFGFKIKKLYLCDLMENELQELNTENSSAMLTINPFEIVSLKAVI